MNLAQLECPTLIWNDSFPVNSTIKVGNEEYFITHSWKRRNEGELVCLAKHPSNTDEYVLVLTIGNSFSIKEKGGCAIIEYKLLN